ncbi:MAG: transposase, partial [Myxococcota bacterium]
VMDNLRAHKGRDVADAIEAMGAKVLFLPPYSPELNPIEMMWHVIKVALRKMRARTVERLFVGIRQALESVDLSYFSAWFAHCGYPQPS